MPELFTVTGVVDNPEILYGYYNGLKDITNAIITLSTENGISEKEIRDILNSGESELNTKLAECKDKINHQVTKTAFKLEDVTITVTANGNSEYLNSRVNLISTIIQNLLVIREDFKMCIIHFQFGCQKVNYNKKDGKAVLFIHFQLFQLLRFYF